MKNLRSTIARSAVTLGVTGVGLLFAAQTASAAPITFTVVETVVPGALPNELEADKISSTYVEDITLSGNNFTADLIVTFTGYNLGGATVPSQVGECTTGEPQVGCPATDYGLYAEVTVTGTFTASPDPDDANQTVFDFDPLTALASVYLDPDQNRATADSLLLTASAINQLLSDGLVTVLTSTGQVIGGQFTLVFTNGDTTALGDLYWPDFAGLVLVATATGDVDETSFIVPGQGGRVTGEASINFEGVAAPEPASMTLFGLALLGSGIAARRRRIQ